MSKIRQYRKVKVQPELTKVHIKVESVDVESMTKHMEENYGMSYSSVKDLPDGAASGECLIDFIKKEG